MDKRALITGITGQDGSYLADLLLHQGYEVIGIIRPTSSFNTERIDHLLNKQKDIKFKLVYGELTDYGSLVSIIRDNDPHEIYHLGAQSHVKISFDVPISTGSVTGLGTTAILEAARKTESDCKFYQASSSEMFGATPPPQSETSKFHPRSPYAAAKVYAYWITVNYRESYGMFASNGILFNHESPRRGGRFVTKKITNAIARIKAGLQDYLVLGNMDAKRDWGYAPEYVEGMNQIMKYSSPDDFVLGTGKSYSVRDFTQQAFGYAGIENWEKYVKTDPKYFRPAEVDHLESNPSKAENLLGWKANIHSEQLVKIMLDYDLQAHNLEHPQESIEILNQNELLWVQEHFKSFQSRDQYRGD